MSNRTVEELLMAYMDQEKMHSMEGHKGVKHLCKIAGALGYKDPRYFGQLDQNAFVGDLLEMMADNSGMIEAMVEWIKSRNFSEFREPLEALVPEAEMDSNSDEWDEMEPLFPNGV